MAFPQVASGTVTEFFGGATTTHNVTMPATVDAGDLLLAMMFITGTSTITATGWTEVRTRTTSGNTERLSVLAKVAVGNEGGTTVNFQTSSAAFAIVHLYRISGWFGDIAGVAAFMVSDTGSNPNPPILTPSWGFADTLWLAVGAKAAGTVTAAPANYTNFLSGPNNDNMGSARRELAAASQDPLPFVGSTSAQWVAATIGVRPEEGASPVSIEAAPVSAIGTVQSVLAVISQAIQSVPVFGSLLAQPVSPSPAALNVPAVPSLLSGAVQPVSPVLDAKNIVSVPSLLSGAVQPVSPVLDAKAIVSVPVLTSGGVQPVLPVMGAFSLEAAPALGQGNVQPLQLALTGVGIPAAPVVANGDAVPTLLGLGELRFASLSASLIGSSQPVLIRGGVVTIQAETVASSLVALAGQLGLGSLSVDVVPVLGQGEVRTVQPVSSEEPTLVTAEVAGATGLSVPADVLLSSFSLLATPVQGLAAPQPVTLQLAEKLITASPAEGQAIASPIGVSLSELHIPGLPADASLQGMPTLIILDDKIIALVPADGVAAAVAMLVRSSELLIQAVVNARFVRQEAEGSFNRTVVPTRFGRIIVLGYKEPE